MTWVGMEQLGYNWLYKFLDTLFYKGHSLFASLKADCLDSAENHHVCCMYALHTTIPLALALVIARSLAKLVFFSLSGNSTSSSF